MSNLQAILSGLVGEVDNEGRKQYENLLNDFVERNPAQALLELAQLGTQAPDTNLRSFSLVVLRRISMKSNPKEDKGPVGSTLITALPNEPLAQIKSTLLQHLLTEPDTSTRNRLSDMISSLALACFSDKHPWTELLPVLWQLSQSPDAGLRKVAFNLYAEVPGLVLDQPIAVVKEVFAKALQDVNLEVRMSAMRGACEFLQDSPKSTREQCADLMLAVLSTLPPLAGDSTAVSLAIHNLLSLASTQPLLFAPHISVLLPLMVSLAKSPPEDPKELGDPQQVAVELLLTLAESKPQMVRKWEGGKFVKDLSELSMEFLSRLEDVENWGYIAPPVDEDEEEELGNAYSQYGEECLDRLSFAIGGNTFLPILFQQQIPHLIQSPTWQHRYAALMSIASITEGSVTKLTPRISDLLKLVLSCKNDPHPRIRFAVAHALGQMSSDFNPIIQSSEVFSVPILSTINELISAPEPRVQVHAGAALVNWCDGAPEPDLVIPFLGELTTKLVTLLQTPGDENGWIREQVVTSIAVLASAAEEQFAPYYKSLMPLLLSYLSTTPRTPETAKLRGGVIECCGLIGLAVGSQVFKQDALPLANILLETMNELKDPGREDEDLLSYVVQAWGRICEALGAEFEPYMSTVMPMTLASANLKPDLSVFDDDDDEEADYAAYEVVDVDGSTVGIKTAVLEEKAAAFEMLIIYTQNLGLAFKPYMEQTMTLALESLNFYFHDGVRESSTTLIPMLMSTAKQAGVITPPLLEAVFSKLTACLAGEADASFLSFLFKSFGDCSRVVGPENIPKVHLNSFERCVQTALEDMADRRKLRAERSAEWDEEDKEAAWELERLEDQALTELENALKTITNNNQNALFMISAVKDLGVAPPEDWEDE